MTFKITKHSMFPGQNVTMADGSLKLIEDIKVGDNVHLGGKVLKIEENGAYHQNNFDDIKVTPGTIVQNKGTMMYVEDAVDVAVLYDFPQKTYSIETEEHLLVLESVVIGDSTNIVKVLGISFALVKALFLNMKRTLLKH